jgi:hypothetical protein
MTITTIEELEELDHGTRLTLNGTTWERLDGGLRCIDPATAVLPLTSFGHELARFELAGEPDLAAEVQRLNALLAEKQQEITSLNGRHASVVSSRDRLSVALAELKDALGDWGKGEDDIDSDLRDIFDEHEVEYRNMEEIQVEVSISGTTCVEFDDHIDIDEVVGNGNVTWDRDYSSVRCDVSWSTSFTITVEAQGGECACDEVDDQHVESWLEGSDITYGSFTIDDKTCPYQH